MTNKVFTPEEFKKKVDELDKEWKRIVKEYSFGDMSNLKLLQDRREDLLILIDTARISMSLNGIFSEIGVNALIGAIQLAYVMGWRDAIMSIPADTEIM